LGGGLKWNESIAIVNLNASVFYDRYGTDYYDGDHFSVATYASVPLLMFTPYVGLGYDYSAIKTKDLGLQSGLTSYDDVMRYTAGVRFQPIPFVYAYGAYTYTKYNHGFQGGVGVNF
jgi:glutathione S-transferase